MIINLICDILDKIDYNENVNYKLNKTNNNNQDCVDIKNYKNRNEIDILHLNYEKKEKKTTVIITQILLQEFLIYKELILMILLLK